MIVEWNNWVDNSPWHWRHQTYLSSVCKTSFSKAYKLTITLELKLTSSYTEENIDKLLRKLKININITSKTHWIQFCSYGDNLEASCDYLLHCAPRLSLLKVIRGIDNSVLEHGNSQCLLKDFFEIEIYGITTSYLFIFQGSLRPSGTKLFVVLV